MNPNKYKALSIWLNFSLKRAFLLELPFTVPRCSKYLDTRVQRKIGSDDHVTVMCKSCVHTQGHVMVMCTHKVQVLKLCNVNTPVVTLMSSRDSHVIVM